MWKSNKIFKKICKLLFQVEKCGSNYKFYPIFMIMEKIYLFYIIAFLEFILYPCYQVKNSIISLLLSFYKIITKKLKC